MAHSNYYLMLGLPFDPPEQRSEEINRIIEKKQHEWSRGTMDFKKGPVYREYMALLPDIRRVMLDKNLRDREAKEAIKIMTDLVEQQLTIASKRGYLYEQEILYIARKCQVSKEMVERVCQVPIRYDREETSTICVPEKFDHFQVFLVYLEALQKKDYYDYLRQGRPYEKVRKLPARELLRLAGKIVWEQGQYTSTESANEKLCAECKRTFASKEGKQSYDEYLAWKDVQAVFEQIKTATQCTKVLEKEQRKEAEKLLEKACGSQENARRLLKTYMEQQNIEAADEERSAIKKDNSGVPQKITKGMPQGRGERYKEISVSPMDQMNRASYLYPTVVRIREAMSLSQFDEADYILQEALKQCGEVPELMRIKDQLGELRRKLASLLASVQACMEKRYFYEANESYVQLKKEFPSYENHAIESKLNASLIRGKSLLSQAETAKEEQILIRLCIDALQVCADYPGVIEMLERYPPRISGTIRVTVDSIHHCNYIHWADTRKDAYVQYVVMRTKDAKPYHRKDGVILATVEGNSFVDREVVPGVTYFYGVYASRCGILSNGLFSVKGSVNFCEVMGARITCKKAGVEITWSKVPLGAVVEVYRAKDYVPATPLEGIRVMNVTTTGCHDQEVVPGNIYGYRIYAVYLVRGEKQYSTGIPLRINTQLAGYASVTNLYQSPRKSTIGYSFEVKKRLTYPYKLLVHIGIGQYGGTIPSLVVVGGEQNTPIDRSTGMVVLVIPAQEIKNELVCTIKYKEVSHLRFFNLFLQREEDAAIYTLERKNGTTI